MSDWERIVRRFLNADQTLTFTDEAAESSFKNI